MGCTQATFTNCRCVGCQQNMRDPQKWQRPVLSERYRKKQRESSPSVFHAAVAKKLQLDIISYWLWFPRLSDDMLDHKFSFSKLILMWPLIAKNFCSVDFVLVCFCFFVVFFFFIKWIWNTISTLKIRCKFKSLMRWSGRKIVCS